MDMNFSQWEDIRNYLNGYSMKSASFDSNGNLMAETSQGKLILARAVGNFWEPVDGLAYTSVDLILMEAKEIISESDDRSRSYKEKVLLDLVNHKVIPLFDKYKK